MGLGISLELRLLAKILSFFMFNITVAAKEREKNESQSRPDMEKLLAQ